MAIITVPGPAKDQEVEENNTCYLEFDVIDPNDSTGETKVPGSSVTTATLSLSNRSGTYKDILSDVDVKAKIDTNGHFKHLLTAADNDIIDDTDTPKFEDHIATVTINFTAGGDAHQVVKNIRVRVLNQQFIT